MAIGEGARRKGVAAFRGLCFLTLMRALAPQHTPADLCILALVLLVLSRPACLPAQMLDHGQWLATFPPRSSVSTPQFGHASVQCLPLSVWNSRLKLGHLAIRAPSSLISRAPPHQGTRRHEVAMWSSLIVSSSFALLIVEDQAQMTKKSCDN